MFLPKPTKSTLNQQQQQQNNINIHDNNLPSYSQPISLKSQKPSHIPSYPNRKLSHFIPKVQSDYGDGGSYPEIHVTQYPLNMGKTKSGPQHTGILALQTDTLGNINYDLVIHNDPKSLVQTSHDSIVPMDIPSTSDSYKRPNEELVQSTADRTRQALEKIVDFKVKSAKPKDSIIAAPTGSAPTYIRYTPANQSAQNSSISNSKIIRMSEAPVDPFEPPKFKIQKVPRGPPSPPPPVMHSPPRKVSAEEQKNWVIPACISNWKNNKGYTIPLEKRLAADGRGLLQVTINDNFAKLSEALFIADRHAREEVKLRSEMQNKLAEKVKKDKEEKLRLLAQKARQERGTFAGKSTQENLVGVGDYGSSDEEDAQSVSHSPQQKMDARHDEPQMSAAQLKQYREREEIRQEKSKQREKEVRMSHMRKSDSKARLLGQQQERDISEKIALGLAKPTMSTEAMFDSRLFNQSHGMASGFGGDDEYSLYDKPLFTGSSAAAIYRPKAAGIDAVGGVDQEKIDRILSEAKPHKGFQGTDSTDMARDGPVQFEKEVDPFGFNEFMGSAKRGRENDDSSSQKRR